MKILQLASFSGNVGDNAHVAGLRNSLKHHLGSDLTFQNMEIRCFYKSWNEAHFDHEFAKEVNQYDALIIGGGGIFDMNFPYSVTGTTIDLPNEILDSIQVPVIFYGLGCNQLQDPAKECIVKFRAFLDKVLTENKCLVSVRNDGSLEVIEKYVGHSYSERIHEIPDPGFFFQLDDAYTGMYDSLLKKGEHYMGLCIAGDEAQSRYGDKEHFVIEMGKALQTILKGNPDLNLVFFPHIYQDIAIIYGILKHLPDPTRRLKTLMAPCFQGLHAEQHIFSLYKKCDLVVSNRFHGIVVPVTLGIPSIAFCDLATRKVNKLIEKINLPEYKYAYTRDLTDLPDFVDGLLGRKEAFVEKSEKILCDLKRMNDGFMGQFASML